MAFQASVTARNAMLDQVETTIGTSAKMRFYTGSEPANCAASATGTQLCEIPLPSDWMAAAASGSKALSGTWSAAASAAGTAGYWRIYDNAGTTCHLQGNITATGGGGDLTMDSTTIANGQTILVNSFTWTQPNS